MSFLDEYRKALKKEEEEQKKVTTTGKTSAGNDSGSFMDTYRSSLAGMKQEDDIAPFKTTVGTISSKKDERKWFEKGLFEDGYDIGDISKTILGTLSDASEDILRGAVKTPESIWQGLMELAPAMTVANQAQNSLAYNFDIKEYRQMQKDAEENKKLVSYDEEKVSKQILGNLYGNFQNIQMLQNGQMLTEEDLVRGQENAKVAKEYIDNQMEAESVLGERSDSALQSAGQMLLTKLINPAIPWQATSGLSALGSEAENAKMEGATDDEATISGLVSAGGEVLSEYFFGGFFGEVGMDDAMIKGLSRKLSNKFFRNASAVGVKGVGEGLEEGFSWFVSNLGKKLTYADDKTWKEIYTSEEALDELWESMVAGAALGGINSTVEAIHSNAEGVDYASGLTDNEQKVVDKVYKDLLAEQEGKVTEKVKKKLYDRVLNDLEKGYISTDTIESVLAEEKYQPYKETLDEESAIREELKAYQTEYDNLGKKDTLTLEDTVRREELTRLYTEAKAKLEDKDRIGKRDYLKANLDKEVYELTKGSKLTESFFEDVRSKQKFEADVSKYQGKAREVIQKVIDSGLVDNTNRMHEFWDTAAQISADKDIDISVATTDQILDMLENEAKEDGLEFDRSAFDGKTIDGVWTKNGIVLNPKTKRALNFVVGHEITHSLEKSDHYKDLQKVLFNYGKQEYQQRFDARAGQYKDIYTDGKYRDKINKEVTADMVGDYLFTDFDFVRHLSTENRNVFQRVWDEIKYLYKVATAGSQEARELEKVKKTFEKVWRETGKAQTDTKLSVSDSDGKELTKEQSEYFKDSKMRDEEGNLKVMYHGSQDAGFHVFDAKFSDDDTSFFFVDRNDVAASYSGTTETYEARSFNTAEDANKFFAEIGKPYYEVVEENGKFVLLENGDFVAESNTAQGIYEEYCDWDGVGYGDANYKVYLNLTNPLEVDAKGRNWNNVSREYSQEVADRYHSLTTEEKDALYDLAGWGEISIFRDAKKNPPDAVTESAFEKLGDANIYDMFSIAEDNFSEETIQQFAVKQMNTRDYAQKAKAEGYDGVIFKNIHDNGGYSNGSEGASTVAIAFESNQIKSVANAKPTADIDIRYSLSEAENQKGLDSAREVEYSISYDTDYSDAAIKLNETQKNVDPAVLKAAKDVRAYVAKRLTEMTENGVALPPDEIGQTWHKDESYGGSMENTLVCPRSLAPEAFMDAVSKNVGRPLTVKEQIYVGQELMSLMTTSEELRGQSFLAQCVYCYVAADRMAQREFLGEYIKQRDAVLAKVNPDMDTSLLEADHNALAAWWENKKSKKPELSEIGKLYQEFLNKRKPTGATYSRFQMWVDNYVNGSPMIDGNHLASIEEIAGDLSNFEPAIASQIRDAWKYAQSASWAKKRTSYVAYNGQILNWDSDIVNALNEHYGMRMYSFSDYHPAFVLENMQMITDAAVRGLKTLAYTKDLDFAEIFAPTHANINISTFGFEKNGQVYEDNQMGAEWAKAKALREQYPNVGITFVATNDTITEWAMKQDWIDVVIPYHMVKTGKIIAEHFGYKNYTRESSDKKTKKWRTDKAWKEDHVSSIAPTMHDNNLETYLAALDANGLKPRFERFLKNPETRPYYMKLVNECRLPASQSQAVEPKFNEDAIERTLARLATEGYYTPIGGSVDRMMEIAANVAESMPSLSVSDNGQNFKQYGNWNVYNRLPSEETVSEMESIAPVKETAEESTVVPELTDADRRAMFPDAPADDPAQELERLTAERNELYSALEAAIEHGTANEVGQLAAEYDSLTARIRELEKAESGRAETMTDADAPAEMEAPLNIEDAYEDKKPVVADPFENRDWSEAKNLTSIMEERPDLKPFFMEEALNMLGDYNDSQKAELLYNDELYYDSGGEKGWMGHKRLTSEDIEEILDDWNIGWDALERGLTKIANGEAKTAVPKKLEFMINRRLLHGYKDFHTGRWVEPNQAYIEALREYENQKHYEEERNSFFANADDFAPPAAEVAPLKTATPDTMDAPIFESRDKKAVKGQTTMFEPPKPNPKVATVLTEESAIAKEKSGIGSKLVSALVDKGMVFENLSLKTGNHELQSKYNYALPSNTEARAQYLMEHGDKGVKSLKDIKTRVERSGKADTFFEYMYHVHNIDRMTLEDRFPNTENKPVFGETVTADVSRKKVAQFERNNPSFKSMAADIYRYNGHLRKLLVDNGVISQETADLWQKMYPHYVPIRRVDSKGQNISVPLDTNKTGVNNPIKRATGGNSDITPLFNTMAQRTEQTYRAIARNAFGIELKNALGSTINAQENTSSVDETIDTLVQQEEKLLKPGTMNSNPTFTVFENGERVEFEITEDMFDALKPAGKLLGYRNPAVKAVGDARRNLLTVWNPVFALYRNPIKDIQDVAVNSQHAAKTYLNVPNAIVQLAMDTKVAKRFFGETEFSKYAEEYHKNGGKSNTYFDGRANKFKAEDNVFKKVVGMPVRAIENAGEFIEEIPRLAEYIASRQEGRSVERSMLDASRVTTNFAAGGDFTKFLNSHGFTFLNASVQGASQHVRNIREAKQQGLKGWLKVAAKYAVAGLPTIFLNSMIWDDDEEYEELSDYVKQNYYVVAKTQDGKFVRIPKGRTAAVMGELFQQMEHLVTGDDEVDFSTFNDLFWDNIAPNNPLDNNILAPVIQTLSNNAWYGGDIVPSRLQDVPAEEQYDESTDSISKWLGEKTGTSPYKWNYLIDQYSGGLGDVFLPMLTPEAESGDNSALGNFLAPWKKEITTDSVLNNKYPGNFYDLRDELEKKANSSKATEEDTMRSMYMDSVSWDMSDLYQQKREIQNSDLTDAEKYEQVREIQEQINSLAESAMNGYNSVSVSGLYAEVGDRRYNMDAESGKWYEIHEKNADGSDNYYYQMEQEVTKALGISYEDYWNNREEYNYAYEKPDQYALSQAVGGYQAYKSYTSELWDIKADKDEDGKSIAYSRKNKVIDYINNMDADYGTKIILFKSEYNADDTYNQDIIDYLNSRDDISYEEMESILKYLDFEVDSEGNISW